MTVVKFKQPIATDFNSLMNGFLPSMTSLFRDDLKTAGLPFSIPVNIKEIETAYALEVVAPGLEKEDFQISLEKNNLTIAVEVKSEKDAKAEKFLKKEYHFKSFQRSFLVDDNIDAEKISAQYVNGILVLNLPKKEKVIEQVKQISIQ